MQRLGSVELIVRGRRAADAMGVALILAQFCSFGGHSSLLTHFRLSIFRRARDVLKFSHRLIFLFL